MLRQFVKALRGRRSQIVLIPTASSFQQEVTDAYTEVFTRLGAGGLDVVNPATRADAHSPASVAAIDLRHPASSPVGAAGVVLAAGTPVGDALHRAPSEARSSGDLGGCLDHVRLQASDLHG